MSSPPPEPTEQPTEQPTAHLHPLPPGQLLLHCSSASPPVLTAHLLSCGRVFTRTLDNAAQQVCRPDRWPQVLKCLREPPPKPAQPQSQSQPSQSQPSQPSQSQPSQARASVPAVRFSAPAAGGALCARVTSTVAGGVTKTLAEIELAPVSGKGPRAERGTRAS